MRHIEHDIVWRGSRGPHQKPLSEGESSAAPTVREACFEAGVILCLALGAALIAQLLLGGL